MPDVDISKELAPEERDAAIESVAKWIVERRLETPAVLFLDMHKPLSFLAGQSLLVAIPFLGPLLGADRMADISKILQDRENVERLIRRIEEVATETHTARCARNDSASH